MNPEKKQNTENPQSSKWDILTKYDEDERSRVNKMKEKAKADSLDRMNMEAERIDVPPSTIRKLGRSVLDLINLTIPAVEKKRNREAMSVALDELNQEEDEELVKGELDFAQKDVARSVRQIMDEEEAERRDRERLERQMADVRDEFNRNKERRLKNERAQEIVERSLNQRLVQIDDLEEQVMMENPEVGKRSVEYEGEEIPVYDLKGYPFSMISHAIDYRSANIKDKNHIGVQTMEALLEDPSIWAQTEEEARESEGYGTRNGNARGNAISTSYINSENNLSTRVGNLYDYTHTCYGFSHLGGDSIIDIFYGDGGTSNMAGKSETGIDEYKINVIEGLEGANRIGGYNEVLLRRYDETGKPRLPDYIIAEDGRITDAMKKHAKYFGIPIVNIDKKAYSEKEKQSVIDAVDAINEESSYEDIAGAVEVIKRKRDFYNTNFRQIDQVGNGADVEIIDFDRRSASKSSSEIAQKVVDAEVIELEKRLEYIENEIAHCIDEVKKANEAGVEYQYKSDVLKRFSIDSYDVNSDEMTFISDGYLHAGNNYRWNGVGSMSHIKVEMRFVNGTNPINTTIFDGEYRHRAEEYYQVYPSYREKDKKCSSDEYNKLITLEKEYVALLEENKRIISDKKANNAA